MHSDETTQLPEVDIDLQDAAIILMALVAETQDLSQTHAFTSRLNKTETSALRRSDRPYYRQGQRW